MSQSSICFISMVPQINARTIYNTMHRYKRYVKRQKVVNVLDSRVHKMRVMWENVECLYQGVTVMVGSLIGLNNTYDTISATMAATATTQTLPISSPSYLNTRINQSTTLSRYHLLLISNNKLIYWNVLSSTYPSIRIFFFFNVY